MVFRQLLRFSHGLQERLENAASTEEVEFIAELVSYSL
jgi:hypothetical protein